MLEVSSVISCSVNIKKSETTASWSCKEGVSVSHPKEANAIKAKTPANRSLGRGGGVYNIIF